MQKYLFVFDFETPAQSKNNDLFEYNDKDTEMVYIKAEKEEQAFLWGRKIAEKYVREMYNNRLMPYTGAAHIEKNETQYAPEILKKVPIVLYGMHPDIESMLLKRYGKDLDEWRSIIHEKVLQTTKSNKKYYIIAAIIIAIIILFALIF
ncbi:MAG: hypothetical protein A2Y62_06480 [Candidatus Fischerbacteria bacterium RBG_13_37_8]|uniref:Uncharacterized protein n=1 Tax=Candidatus Fischerbacteria bacterium RBG_13_37_8 TaxID=1817863 RepID=A0A1F5VDX5_9BACT|nr:MAG: hypothetical protein A2Y62_06480 [Candidatus Fischerbacteria bacterium RBG_13_37_8]